MRFRDHLESRDHYVYIAWRGDEPLYVGCTSNPDQRMKSWGMFLPNGGWPSTATHVDVWHVGRGVTNGERIERETIETLDPTHNIRHSPRAAERDRRWAEYSEWAEAYSRSRYDTEGCAWALDQTTADRVCGAVGYVAPNIAVARAEEWDRLSQIVAAVGVVRFEAAS